MKFFALNTKSILPLLFLFFLCSILFFVRSVAWKNLLINVDEVEWLYCLQKCYTNPLPILGFDAHTSGPFSIYLISGIKLFWNDLNVQNLRIYGFFAFIIPSFLTLFYYFNGRKLYLSITIFFSLLCIYNKDFFAYNNEYPIILFLFIGFTIILQKKSNVVHQVVLSLIILLIPLIKFQAILFSILFFSLQTSKLYFNKDKKTSLQLILSIIFFILLGILILLSLGVVEDFYNNYILRNLFHTTTFVDKSMFFTFLENMYFQMHFFLIYFLLIGVYFYNLCKKRKFAHKSISIYFRISEKNRPIVYSLIFLTVTWITTLVPKTNFTHYFQFMFVPIVFSTTFIINRLSVKTSLIVVILNLNLFNFLNEYMHKNVTIGEYIHPINYEFIDTNSSYDLKIDSLISKYIPKNNSVIYLGWFTSLPFYYKHRNKYTFKYRSGHTHFLTQIKNENIAKKEESYLLNDLISGVNYVVDFENVLQTIDEKGKLAEYVKYKYRILYSDKHLVILKRISIN